MKKMEISVFLIAICIILFFSNCSSTKQISVKENVNYDLIERDKVLKLLSKKLNRMIPNYRSSVGKNKFYSLDGITREFSVIDLVDTLNNSRSWDKKIYFKRNHIYYYYPVKYEYSISNIFLINGKGEFIFFDALNCETKGDKIEDVINYLNDNFENSQNKNQIISNVKNYRKYGNYLKSDYGSIIKCEDIR